MGGRACIAAVASVGLACCAAEAAEEFCENDTALIDIHFEGGAFHRCKVRGGNFVITIRAEDSKVVVPMPWYAFRASPKQPGEVVILMGFVDAEAERFWPKVSADGKVWRPLAKESVAVSKDGKRLALRFGLTETAVWIASQGLVTSSYYGDWMRSLAARGDVAVRTLGRSVQGRPITVAETAVRSEAVLLLGRQHPPEVTGAFNMRTFLDTVLADTDLAQAFRARFMVVAAPLLNPDGVAAGHWRHNAGKTDLNRDWGPFKQPETRHIEDLMDGLDEKGIALELMLDFHSTQLTETQLFYTQRAEDGDGSAYRFAAGWFERVRARQPNLEFLHRPGKSDQANAKNYFHERYGIPSITYETGDETDPAWIAEAAQVFAEELMKALLGRA